MILINVSKSLAFELFHLGDHMKSYAKITTSTKMNLTCTVLMDEFLCMFPLIFRQLYLQKSC